MEAEPKLRSASISAQRAGVKGRRRSGSSGPASLRVSPTSPPPLPPCQTLTRVRSNGGQMPSPDDFFSLYRHGFVRVAVATPRVRIGDPRHNTDATLELMQQAARDKALLAVFPELGLSAYTCEDLFHQQTLIDAAENALAQLLARTRKLPLAALVGLPVAVDGRLYHCAALLCRGRLVGAVP